MSYVVTAPYVTLRVKDQAGSDVLRGFYAGGVLPDDVNETDLDKHVRKGLIAEQGTPEADAATPYGQRVQFDDLGNPVTPDPAADAKKRQERPQRAAESKPRPESKAPTGNA